MKQFLGILSLNILQYAKINLYWFCASNAKIISHNLAGRYEQEFLDRLIRRPFGPKFSIGMVLIFIASSHFEWPKKSEKYNDDEN